LGRARIERKSVREKRTKRRDFRGKEEVKKEVLHQRFARTKKAVLHEAREKLRAITEYRPRKEENKEDKEESGGRRTIAKGGRGQQRPAHNVFLKGRELGASKLSKQLVLMIKRWSY